MGTQLSRKYAGGIMASFAAGIFNHAKATAQSFTGNNPLSSPTAQAASDGASNTSTSSASISANDFLTLLVTEMKNQDPTANTDPNEYINQLVNVNSLEQLIDINQTLSSALGDSSKSSGSPVTTQATATADPFSQSTTASDKCTSTFTSAHTVGNLSVPRAVPAAQSVAHALSGQTRPQSVPSALRDLQ
jgi:flagellar basal-body rod modification protein FlgD